MTVLFGREMTKYRAQSFYHIDLFVQWRVRTVWMNHFFYEQNIWLSIFVKSLRKYFHENKLTVQLISATNIWIILLINCKV